MKIETTATDWAGLITWHNQTAANNATHSLTIEDGTFTTNTISTLNQNSTKNSINGTITINGGTFNIKEIETVRGTRTSGGKIIIGGGIFNGLEKIKVSGDQNDNKDVKGTITIEGGKFKLGGSLKSADIKAFVEDTSKTVIKSGDYFVVVAATVLTNLQEAFETASKDFYKLTEPADATVKTKYDSAKKALDDAKTAIENLTKDDSNGASPEAAQAALDKATAAIKEATPTTPSTGGGGSSNSGSGNSSSGTGSSNSGSSSDSGSSSGGSSSSDSSSSSNDSSNGSGGSSSESTETETPITNEEAKELVENMDDTVSESPAGQAIIEVLSDSDPVTQDAAIDVVNTLNESLTSEEIAVLTKDEIEAAVKNKAAESADAAAEAQNDGVVEDTTKPAGTDIIANSETASEALQAANETLSVQPKVVTPEAVSEAEVNQIASDLSTLSENDVDDDDVDLDMVKAAANDLKSTNDIYIETANGNLNAQAEKIEAVFEDVAKNLPRVSNASGGTGVVIVSVLPRMTPRATGFFPMKVNLRNLTPGRKLMF
ncbi:MAG: hypothetical protein IJ859_09020, partial [Synergistaceae bacterium]|nr:hypothetical protein [Synergistaceae bacterium]